MTRSVGSDARFAHLSLVGGIFTAAVAALMWSTKTIATKGLSGIVEIAAVAAAPVLAWIAWARPLIFPYGLYVVIAPLDVLTSTGSHQGTIARLLGLLSGAALLLFAIRTRSLRMPPRAIVVLALLCGWMALSTLWSAAAPADAGREAATLLEIAGLYLAIAAFPTQKRDLPVVLGSILIGGVVAAGIGAYEFHAAGAREVENLQDFHRISVTIGRASLDPNMYADSLLLPFAIALTWFARSRRALWSLAALAAMGIIVIAIALAGSRDATIGLGIVTVSLIVMLRAYRRVLLPTFAMIAVALALYPNAILRAAEDAGGGYGRTSIWDLGITGFLQHPIVGWGSGSFGAVYDRLYVRVFERYDVGWHMASHDLFIHYGVELGAIGLVLVLAWCVSQWMLARSLPATGVIGDVRAICLASLGALAFAALFIDLFDVKFVWIAFALVAQARSAALLGRELP